MIICKLLGLVALVISFCISIKGWIKHAEKDNILGMVISYILCIGSMFGAIYLINN